MFHLTPMRRRKIGEDEAGRWAVSIWQNCFHLRFHFEPKLTSIDTICSDDVSNVSIFLEEFYKKT